MRIDKSSVFGNSTDAVGVAVGGQTGVAALFDHGFLKHRHMGLDRLGIDSRKQRIQILTNCNVLDAPFREDFRQHASPRAMHRINGELKLGLGNQVQIGKTTNGLDVSRLEVDFLNMGRVAVRLGASTNLVLDELHDRRRGRAAEFGFEFHAIPVPGIVAGSDDHAARGP